MSKPARHKKSKAEKRGRRKPRLNEDRVKVIASTYEYEVGWKNFEIVGISLKFDDPDEWSVITKIVIPGAATIEGGDKVIMVNDKTGKARYYHEYLAEKYTTDANVEPTTF